MKIFYIITTHKHQNKFENNIFPCWIVPKRSPEINKSDTVCASSGPENVKGIVAQRLDPKSAGQLGVTDITEIWLGKALLPEWVLSYYKDEWSYRKNPCMDDPTVGLVTFLSFPVRKVLNFTLEFQICCHYNQNDSPNILVIYISVSNLNVI